MSDSYQAIYDAVRSRISGGNIGEVVERVARQAFDISHHQQILYQEFSLAAYEMARPSVLYRPTIMIDGTKWCALYGENLHDGVAGFGDTPAEAMADFDREWLKRKTLDATRQEREDNAQFGVGA